MLLATELSHFKMRNMAHVGLEGKRKRGDIPKLRGGIFKAMG